MFDRTEGGGEGWEAAGKRRSSWLALVVGMVGSWRTLRVGVRYGGGQVEGERQCGLGQWGRRRPWLFGRRDCSGAIGDGMSPKVETLKKSLKDGAVKAHQLGKIKNKQGQGYDAMVPVDLARVSSIARAPCEAIGTFNLSRNIIAEYTLLRMNNLLSGVLSQRSSALSMVLGVHWSLFLPPRVIQRNVHAVGFDRIPVRMVRDYIDYPFIQYTTQGGKTLRQTKNCRRNMATTEQALY